MRAAASIILASIILAIVGPALGVAIPSDPLLSKRGSSYRVDAYQDMHCAGLILKSLEGSHTSMPKTLTFYPQANCAKIVQEVPTSCTLFLLHGEEHHLYDGPLAKRQEIELVFDGMRVEC
ncbi:hypothetical protein F5050DRAFT_1074124 [Lentinula boryana]|uniref:Uncharacterized protein n=1 Tax=Lentinula boryana TaxID=40481 RepID=A0ABQ8QL45_9AGAR|nr:hypothetical protein F5050DRAFT_1074124 [Lentinula boryana]